MSTTASPPPPSPPPDESLVAHVGRVCKNSFTKCFGAVQTSDEFARIKYREYQIENRKKAFGVAYLQLVHEKASMAALEACVAAAVADTAVTEAEIHVLREEIKRVDRATNQKLVAKPGGAPVTTSTTAAAPPPAAAAATDAAAANSTTAHPATATTTTLATGTAPAVVVPASSPGGTAPAAPAAAAVAPEHVVSDEVDLGAPPIAAATEPAAGGGGVTEIKLDAAPAAPTP